MTFAEAVTAAVEAIARLEMTSNGTTTSYGDGGAGAYESREPRSGHRRVYRDERDPTWLLGDDEPEYLTLRKRLTEAVASRDIGRVHRVRTVALAELALITQRATQAHAERESLQWKRELVQHAGRGNVAETARLFGVTRKRVYVLLSKYGRDAA